MIDKTINTFFDILVTNKDMGVSRVGPRHLVWDQELIARSNRVTHTN